MGECLRAAIVGRKALFNGPSGRRSCPALGGGVDTVADWLERPRSGVGRSIVTRGFLFSNDDSSSDSQLVSGVSCLLALGGGRGVVLAIGGSCVAGFFSSMSRSTDDDFRPFPRRCECFPQPRSVVEAASPAEDPEVEDLADAVVEELRKVGCSRVLGSLLMMLYHTGSGPSSQDNGIASSGEVGKAMESTHRRGFRNSMLFLVLGTRSAWI